MGFWVAKFFCLFVGCCEKIGRDVSGFLKECEGLWVCTAAKTVFAEVWVVPPWRLARMKEVWLVVTGEKQVFSERT